LRVFWGFVRAIQLEIVSTAGWPFRMRKPCRCFNSSPEVIRLTVIMYVRYPLSLRQVKDMLFERAR